MITKQHIRESNLIESIDSKKENKQSMYAWECLIKQEKLTNSVICKTQKIITINQKNLRPDQRGYYRDLSKTNVFVGGHAAPSWYFVRGLMDNWLIDRAHANTRESILKAHQRFEKNHPFVDGNGRTGRMIMWWQEIKAGLEPTLWKNSEKFEKYYPLFNEDS